MTLRYVWRYNEAVDYMVLKGRFMRALLLLILIIAAALPLTAQEATDEPTPCTTDGIAVSSNMLMQELAALQYSALAGDMPDTLSRLEHLELLITGLKAYCIDGELPADFTPSSGTRSRFVRIA